MKTMNEKVIISDLVIKGFLEKIKFLKNSIEGLYLFGSRSRGDWRPDSDYDILVILKERTEEVKSKLYDAALDILLSTGKLISLKIFTLSEFEKLIAIPTPFMENVLREGIKLEFEK